MRDNRSFLLLQGVASPFFGELEIALNNAGYHVLKVNFNGGDLLSGRFLSTAQHHLNYRGKLGDLATFYKNIFKQYAITDIMLFGDTRPIHQIAIEVAKQEQIAIHVYEEGYLRPHWVTLEKDGVNAYSHLPKDPDWYLEQARQQTTQAVKPAPTGGGLAIRAWHDIRYHIAKTLLKPYFPHYKTHRPDNALKEYWGFVRRMPAVKFYFKRKADQQIRQLLDSQKPFYLLPLQLDADSQIRLHSNLKNVTDVIHQTIQSFAQYAPDDAQLVIKNHPLDPWFVDFSTEIKKAAQQHNIDEERLIYLEAGDLIRLLKHAKGTVLVNSTVGTTSLSHDCPVKVLGNALYDMPGLTFQGSLDDFWTKATPPDAKLFAAFQQVLIAKTQINGSFYNQKGIAMAVAGSLSRLHINQQSVHSERSKNTANDALYPDYANKYADDRDSPETITVLNTDDADSLIKNVS